MAKSFEVTCPHCGQTYEVEVPVSEKRRGQLYGIALEDMTDEQLKAAGVPVGLVRISCGLEHKDDLIADIKQALEAMN